LQVTPVKKVDYAILKVSNNSYPNLIGNKQIVSNHFVWLKNCLKQIASSI